MEDAIDPAVGFVITARPGDAVLRGQPLATIHAHDELGIARGREALARAIAIGDSMLDVPLPLVSHRVTAAGVEELG